MLCKPVSCNVFVLRSCILWCYDAGVGLERLGVPPKKGLLDTSGLWGT